MTVFADDSRAVENDWIGNTEPQEEEIKLCDVCFENEQKHYFPRFNEMLCDECYKNAMEHYELERREDDND